MTCRKVRNLMALAAGGDLRPRQAAAFRAHLDKCPACREELEGFRAVLAGIKAAAKAESVPDWNEGEWKALMARAAAGTKGAGEERGRAGGDVFRPRWAAASVLGAAIGLAVLSLLFRGPSSRPDTMAAAADTDGAVLALRQDRLTMTMVSPETGLQVVWILDKNFEWKGDKN